ncbi:S41 family peptidase [Flavobacterium sp. LHD-85]|uniref:S41 family peptidase n=1 Tax=Flavobacterium sp. LHD-85 TaxID=3071410 RepID=UPI0027DF1152|nr:S41 family peptidase [Flavobacterium sp. LHD-85]MDQ6531000.1 S41 family peptidase [Flavobacterium sp. LHD-85]
MKKYILIFLLLVIQTVLGQSKPTEIQKLAITCKIWGYLKYYHPEVASGKTDWDKQLFNVLPKLEEAQTKEEFSSILENWIDALGTIKQNDPVLKPKQTVYFDKNFDLSWISKNKLLSKNLSAKLKFIEDNRYQGEQYYVAPFDAENIFVKNENYKDLNFNDKNPRILALFMYWNLIEYFFPYKYLMDQKWDISLTQMLPLFIEAKSEDDFYIALQKLSVKLNDSHAVFVMYPRKNSLNFFPAKCKIIDEKIIVTEILADSLAKDNGIKVGDIITKINSKTIKEIISEKRALINGSNEAAYLNNVVKSALSGYSENVTLEFLKDGSYTTKTINWYEYYISHKNEYVRKNKKEKFKILENNIGYVNMGTLKVQNIPAMIEKLNSTKAIVFDMRNYPNGTFEEIAKFLNSKEKEFAIYTTPDLSYPGRYKWTNAQKCGSENNNNYKGKVIVLLSEDSMSQAEWTAMCFKTADNTTIIGSQTAGADGNVNGIDFIRAFHTQFSGVGVYYPDKSETQRIGIIPDIEIKPTIKGIQQGKDEVLDRAIEFINSGK